ncbi:DUF6207 family protein [Streptomyces sp. WM6378]|uniref:DUF6207 family protein n=1 Tax=Streptomyces sp. WM6378 TaxID=1415557 RepID=UPI0022770A1F|nr:DUF6207 family protein [Streptomyces sp. WM6378]
MRPAPGRRVVVDVAAADDETVLAFQQALAGCWATAPVHRTTRTPGEPGVWLRCYLDLRQEHTSAVDPAGCSDPARPPRRPGRHRLTHDR